MINPWSHRWELTQARLKSRSRSNLVTVNANVILCWSFNHVVTGSIQKSRLTPIIMSWPPNGHVVKAALGLLNALSP